MYALWSGLRGGVDDAAGTPSFFEPAGACRGEMIMTYLPLANRGMFALQIFSGAEYESTSGPGARGVGRTYVALVVEVVRVAGVEHS